MKPAKILQLLSWMVRDANGVYNKPADYLVAFANFIKEQRNDIEAIQILLDRPADWNVAALTELRSKLATAPFRFNEERLQKAHEIESHKAMADIISMVKYAVEREKELYTAAERVQRALMRITGSQKFTAEQLQWLGRVRVHLIENLSISRDDFDDMPVFSHAGGWGRANREFGGRLAEMIQRLNESVAA